VSLADAFAAIYPSREADARQAGEAVDAMTTAGDVFFGGLRDVVRGGGALLRATWTLNKACWRLRGVVGWSDLLGSEWER
jgi:hypothetical protein